MITRFYLVSILSLFGLIFVVVFALIYSSLALFISGFILILVFHQTFYIHGMFSSQSNFFFKTAKGKDFFHNKNGILFRFDDGPDPVYTPQILDILKEENQKGFFALTGKHAELYPEIVQRIFKENHFIGNHTYSHPYNILLLGYHRMMDEVSKTNDILKKITGSTPKYFCPPIGFKNYTMGKVIKELDLIPIMWDIRTLDTHASFEKIMQTIKRNLKSPAIILFHDAVMPWSKKDREATVLALKETIRILKENQSIKARNDKKELHS